MQKAQVIIIGGGLLGCFAARAMAAYDLETIVIEQQGDVCTCISKANSGIIYPGYDQKPGSLKAKLCVRACRNFRNLCAELDVPYRDCGSLMLASGPAGRHQILKKYADGRRNGITGLRLLNAQEIYDKEPRLAAGFTAALYAESTCTVNPWQLGIAAYENAAANGIRFHFNERVMKISRNSAGPGKYTVSTSRGTYLADALINCAGLGADALREMLQTPLVRIRKDAADYLVLDRDLNYLPDHVLLQEKESGKGIGLIPTPEGNLILGPANRKGPDLKDYETDPDSYHQLISMAREVLPDISEDDVIRNFGAVRPNPFEVEAQAGTWVPRDKGIRDFPILNEDGLISLIGIKTPGLTCADELGKYAAALAAESIGRSVRPRSFDPHRKGIRKDPGSGSIVCLCSQITEAEVREAVRRGAKTVEEVKRRVGTGMGHCQGSRCSLKIMEILENEHKECIPAEKPADHAGLLVIGAGAAGMAAALAAEQAGVDVLIAEREPEPGGILRQCIHHGFGQARFGKDMTGPEFAAVFKERLSGSKIRIMNGAAVLRIYPDKRALISTGSGQFTVSFDACLLATGAREKTFYSLPAGGSRPEGIYTAGQVQQLINLAGRTVGQNVVILGSGDIGQIVARRLIISGSRIAAMIERRDRLGGLVRNQKACIEAFHVPVILNATVVRVHGTGRITGVTVRHLDTGCEELLPCDTLITALGLIPDQTLADTLYENGELPPWIRFCGNSFKIYDIIDKLCVDSENLGNCLAHLNVR